MSVYREELRLRSRDVDMFRRLRTSELMRWLQEASIRHTEQLGMGRDKTLDKGILWMLTMQSVEIRRLPVYDEEVVLKSWPGPTMHVLFPRYCSLETAGGEPLLRSSALWTLVDGKTRKMVFPESCGVQLPGVVTGEEIALPRPLAKPAAGESRQFTVPFSYIDINGHMNNSRYYDLAEDLLGQAALGRPLTATQVDFVSEARCGEELTVSWSEDGGVYTLVGETDRCVFRMRLTYGEA